MLEPLSGGREIAPGECVHSILFLTGDDIAVGAVLPVQRNRLIHKAVSIGSVPGVLIIGCQIQIDLRQPALSLSGPHQFFAHKPYLLQCCTGTFQILWVSCKNQRLGIVPKGNGGEQVIVTVIILPDLVALFKEHFCLFKMVLLLLDCTEFVQNTADFYGVFTICLAQIDESFLAVGF